MQDLLWAERYAMVSQALLAQDMLGINTQVFGAAVVPTTPSASLAVFVNPGRIYAMAPLEPSAWSSLAADSTSIFKQGIDLIGSTIACPVLGTSGQSVNYLIEAQYQENDINPQTLSYWNASNPQLPFSGAGNNGIAQPTVRAGQFISRAKAGTPATTGSQTTPAVDAGWTAIAVVTVAFGATTITAGNITQLAGLATSGTFTLTGTGFSGAAPTALASYRIVGPLATISVPSASLFGTSNLNSFTATGVPPILQPGPTAPSNQFISVPSLQDASAAVFGTAQIALSQPGKIIFQTGAALGVFTASGQKGMAGNISYLLN